MGINSKVWNKSLEELEADRQKHREYLARRRQLSKPRKPTDTSWDKTRLRLLKKLSNAQY